MPSGKKLLIIGCGYLGLAATKLLMKKGYAITGWVRTKESAHQLSEVDIEPITGDVSATSDWKQLDASFDAVVHCASSGRGRAEAYHAVYLEGMRQVTLHLQKARTIFVSSTSVYGQDDGSVVTEKSDVQPQTETGKILREAEEAGLQSGAIILRLGGIYGPDRSVFLRKLQNNEAVIEGDGTRWINQIHRDDGASAIAHALERGKPGEIYNVCDNEPVNYITFYQWLAPRLGKPMPPFGPVNPDRKRGLTNKRVANGKLRASGWSPAYPTFREGYEAVLLAS
jgi:nucleoside-diphosphate-sugar epimerase